MSQPRGCALQRARVDLAALSNIESKGASFFARLWMGVHSGLHNNTSRDKLITASINWANSNSKVDCSEKSLNW